MEKKTIGSFIAILRKSSGMTQRDLADRLGVSDKTVSHWEREESAPDLTIIPAIAEIFGVTCDELLRGERIARNAPEEPSGKTEKQVKHLLNRSLAKFRARSMIALGLSLAGVFIALICNFGFNRAYLGFFIGCIFWAAAVICESIFCYHAFYAVGGDDFEGADISPQKPSVFGDPAINDYKISAVRLTGKIISASSIMLGASLPLVIIPFDTFLGITAGAWLLLGLLTAAVTAAICLFAVYAVNNSLLRKGVYTLCKSADITRHNVNRLKVRCTAVFAAIILVLLLGQAYFNSAVGADSFTAGTKFDNFEDFKAYIETEKEGVYYGDTAPERVAAADQKYFDADGNTVTKEQALTEYVYDNAGNALYEYVHLNQEVTFIKYSGAGTDKFTITAYTSEQLRAGEAGREFVNIRWIVLYFVVAGIGFIVYFRKRAKLKKSL